MLPCWPMELRSNLLTAALKLVAAGEVYTQPLCTSLLSRLCGRQQYMAKPPRATAHGEACCLRVAARYHVLSTVAHPHPELHRSRDLSPASYAQRASTIMASVKQACRVSRSIHIRTSLLDGMFAEHIQYIRRASCPAPISSMPTLWMSSLFLTYTRRM